MKHIRLLAVVVILTMTACSVHGPIPFSKGSLIEFTATYGETETKSTLIQDGLLPNGQPQMITWWSPEEDICIYYGASYGNKFTSTNTELSKKVTFRGTLDAFTGQNESGDYNYFWAVYPYDAAVSCDGESVVAILADEQEAFAGSYANNTNITIAKSPGLSLGFYNVCSFLRFTVEKEGVIAATFRGNNNEDVAGKFRVSIGTDGKPTAPEVIEGEKEITLRRPNDEPFIVGESYYFVLLPQTFENGFTIQFNTEDAIGNRVISASAVFSRNSINFGNTAFDHNVTYIPFTVDLGLSVKWASYNLGASAPDGYGDYYAWGETEPYYTKGYAQSDNPIWYSGKDEGYTWSSYEWCNDAWNLLTKYNDNSSHGQIDNNIFIDLEDDAANKKLSGYWRIPTEEEWYELYNSENCIWTWTSMNGVYGYNVESRITGNSIFLPTSGVRDYQTINNLGTHGYYWSSTVNYANGPSYAHSLYFKSDKVYINNISSRCIGLTIRPVFGEIVPVTDIILSQTALTMTVGETVDIDITILPENATYKSTVWTSSNLDIAYAIGEKRASVFARNPGTAILTAYSEDMTCIAYLTITVNPVI